jgi:hypothetical protein
MTELEQWRSAASNAESSNRELAAGLEAARLSANALQQETKRLKRPVARIPGCQFLPRKSYAVRGDYELVSCCVLQGILAGLLGKAQREALSNFTQSFESRLPRKMLGFDRREMWVETGPACMV